MDILPLTPDRYAEWDAFRDQSDEAWYFHTTNCLEHALNYRLEWPARSFSFLVAHEHQVLTVCPLVLECIPTTDGSDTVKGSPLSYGGGNSGPAPALANGLTQERPHEVLATVLSHVDALAQEQEVSRATFPIFPLTPAFTGAFLAPYNFLTRYRYLDVSLSTQWIHLTKDMPGPWKDIHKGHWYEINLGSKAFQIKVLDQHTLSEETFTAYRLMHHRDSGWVTRPLVTFEMQHR